MTRNVLCLLIALLGLWGADRAWAIPLISERFCDRTESLDAGQQDRRLRFAAAVARELDRTGESVAVIARNGIDLSRFKLRYSHAGVALKESPAGRWDVRQLYYDCAQGFPRLFDQGLAGFLFNVDEPDRGFVSIVLLPAQAAESLARIARSARQALGLLGTRYSANAYPFSVAYQNCNQWVAELMAAAWAPLADGDDLRRRAQAWLAEQGYAPEPVTLDSHWTRFAAGFVPLVHLDDYPEDQRYGLSFAFSMPASIEAFVRRRYPQARRLELCQNGENVVIHEGWQSMPDICMAAEGDRIVPLD